MKVLIYNSGGRCLITSVFDRLTVVEAGVEREETEVEALIRCAVRDVPTGVAYGIIEHAALPEDRRFRDQWTCSFDEDGQVTGVVIDSEKEKIRLKELLADQRWTVETGGTAWNSQIIQTDRQSQAMLTGALVMSAGIPVEGIGWKFKFGFAVVTAADIQAMCVAVMTHVQTCFAVEAAKSALITAGTACDILAGWPSNE